MSSCAAPGNCPMGAISVACTSAANCTNGGVCCLSGLGGGLGGIGGFGMGGLGMGGGATPMASCQSACAGGIQICQSSAECNGGTCMTFGGGGRGGRGGGAPMGGICQNADGGGFGFPGGGFGLGADGGGFGGFPPGGGFGMPPGRPGH
jgi:hypothetical protein